MLGRGLLVGLWVLVGLAAAGGCASTARSDQLAAGVLTSAPGVTSSSTTNSAHESPTANAPPGLSATHRALALAAAHLEANQIAVGRNRHHVSGWPSGITAVTAVVQPGSVTDSNTGHTCTSGTIITVRLLGAFNTSTTGTSTNPDNTVRELDLNVDAATGLTCLISVWTEPPPRSRDETVLYSR